MILLGEVFCTKRRAARNVNAKNRDNIKYFLSSIHTFVIYRAYLKILKNILSHM